MRKIKLLKISSSFLLLAGCAQLPPFPEVVQYGIRNDVSPPGFYGVNTKTGERDFRRFNDPHMTAGQCLTAGGYLASEEWIKEIKKIAQKRCK